MIVYYFRTSARSEVKVFLPDSISGLRWKWKHGTDFPLNVGSSDPWWLLKIGSYEKESNQNNFQVAGIVKWRLSWQMLEDHSRLSVDAPKLVLTTLHTISKKLRMRIALFVLQFPDDAFDLDHLPLSSRFPSFDMSLAQFHSNHIW